MADPPEDETFHVADRRRWATENDDDEAAVEPTVIRQPTVLDEFRLRAEEAESKLKEYIAAFRRSEQEQDEFRVRLNADVERRVELRFGELVAPLLATVDDLNLALSHVDSVAEAEPLARGVRMAHDRFLQTLQQLGVVPLDPCGEPFDPNIAEALRIDPVDDAARDGVVTETLQPGYRLGERVVRAARVAVGRYAEAGGSGDGS